MLAFLSYQTDDRLVAAEVREFLDDIAVPAFMAHDDINVSQEWQEVILSQMMQADIFIALLSARYRASPYCLQESGIAISRGAAMTIIPLSIDGTTPPGFIAHLQSRKIEPGNISHAILFAGIAKYDVKFAIDCMVNRLGGSGSYRGAEANFQLLLPHLCQATDEQIKDILQAACYNGQIAHAALCAREYLPPLLASHGHLLDEANRAHLEGVFAQYAN